MNWPAIEMESGVPEKTFPASSSLKGRRVLVVEDTFLIAEGIAATLEDEGCVVVGPASRLAEGVALASEERLDGALLDVNLAGERCFPIAEKLKARGVPFAFLTGYGDSAFPPVWKDAPRLAKPFDFAALARLAAKLFPRGA